MDARASSLSQETCQGAMQFSAETETLRLSLRLTQTNSYAALPAHHAFVAGITLTALASRLAARQKPRRVASAAATEEI